MDAEQASYVTRPTRRTVFLRTFIPWQLWRFAVINLKMIEIIRRSHGSERAERSRAAREHRSGD